MESGFNFVKQKPEFMKTFVGVAVYMACIMQVEAQQTEYRITEKGEYQYLSNRHEAGMVYDESLGSYYKNITIRTFFLETQRRGYIPNYYTFDGFAKLTLPEQKRLLKQPYWDPKCSPDNLTSECLDFSKPGVTMPRQENTKVVDLSPKCVDQSNSPQSKMSLTEKMIVNPHGAGVINNDCGDEPALKPNTNQKKTSDLILKND